MCVCVYVCVSIYKYIFFNHFELPRAKQNQKLLIRKYHCNVNIFTI